MSKNALPVQVFMGQTHRYSQAEQHKSYKQH